MYRLASAITTAKPFAGQTAIHQSNAIRSWMGFTDQVFVFCGEQHDFFLDPLGVGYVEDVAHDSGLPFVNSMFSKAELVCYESNLIVWANADLILLPNIAEALERADLAFTEFLMCGQRWDIDLDYGIDFAGDWPAWLRGEVEHRGVLHSVSGKDWFAWKPPLRLRLPNLLVGRAGWDNFLLDSCIKAHIPVIDATEVVMAVHPNHDYDHLVGGLVEAHIEGPQVTRNLALANVPTDRGRISEATYKMTQGGLENAK